MTLPLVTISIPIYNCEKYLERCLQSVLTQTYPNIEVTLINDQTLDNAVAIAEEFITKNNLSATWILYHLEENSGLSVVRNKGIDTAKGKYIFFLDSDDTITPDCIKILVDIAESDSTQMVVGNTIMIDEETGEERDFFRVKCNQKNLINNTEILEAFVSDSYASSSWNKLILVDFLKKNELYFTKGLFAQDELQSFQTALVLDSLAFTDVDTTTLYYYLHSNSVIHNRNKRHFDNWFTIGQYIDQALKSETNNKRKHLILRYLTHFKSTTLVMNWKAQQNENFWMEQYANYKTLSSLSLVDCFFSSFSKETKKKAFWMIFPTRIGMKLFKKRYNG